MVRSGRGREGSVLDDGERRGSPGPASLSSDPRSCGRARGGGKEASAGSPVGLEMSRFSGEGRSVWVTVHVNLSPDSHSSTQTEASPTALNVPLAWLSETLVWVCRASPFWRVQEMLRLS